jgi:hypothetical protein
MPGITLTGSEKLSKNDSENFVQRLRRWFYGHELHGLARIIRVHL